MDQVAKERLELFVKKSEKLVSGSKLRGLMGVYRFAEGQKWENYEELEGFLLTFRLFLLQRDGIAIYRPNLHSAKELDLLKLPGLSQRWYDQVEQVYQDIAKFMALQPPGRIYNSIPLSRWDILETFLYGDLAHVNPHHRQILEQWQSAPELFCLLQLDFIDNLAFILKQIKMVEEASKKELSL